MSVESDLQRLASLIRQLQGEAWHEIGAVGEPAFENSWANIGGGRATAAFCLLTPRLLAIKGEVGSGNSGTTVFTLPSGAYFPAQDRLIGCCHFDGAAFFPGAVFVRTTGAVQIFASGSANPISNGLLDLVIAL